MTSLPLIFGIDGPSPKINDIHTEETGFVIRYYIENVQPSFVKLKVSVTRDRKFKINRIDT